MIRYTDEIVVNANNIHAAIRRHGMDEMDMMTDIEKAWLEEEYRIRDILEDD